MDIGDYLIIPISPAPKGDVKTTCIKKSAQKNRLFSFFAVRREGFGRRRCDVRIKVMVRDRG